MATIAEKLRTLLTIKNDIKTAIEKKGINVGDVPFTEYSEKIEDISVSGGGYGEGYNNGYNDGYNAGLNDGKNKYQGLNRLNEYEVKNYIDLATANEMESEIMSSSLYDIMVSGEKVLDFSSFMVGGSLISLYISDLSDYANSFETIGKLVPDSWKNLISIRGINCSNIQTVYEVAFRSLPKLSYIGKLTNLGNSFTSEQTIDFTRNYDLNITDEFINSLYDFSIPNKYGVQTSTIKFYSIDADYKQQLEDKGWTIIV